jgi:poly(3-hydroxyalkanoate) depolymerase
MTTELIRVGALRLRVHRRGEGSPLLLINGIGASLEMWEPLLRELPGRELIAFDMPGCGLSSSPLLPLRMRDLVGLVAELMHVLGRSRADVLGYSHGGLVAQELAHRHPERVERLVLCATSPGIPSIPPNPVVTWLMLTPARYYNRSAAEWIVPRIAGGQTRRDPDAMRVNLHRRLAHAPSARSYAYQLWATVGWSSHPWLRRLRQPTLVLHGDDDPLVPVANARYLARSIPGATLQVMPGAGHLLLLDEPARAARHIDAFLATAPTRPAPVSR